MYRQFFIATAIASSFLIDIKSLHAQADIFLSFSDFGDSCAVINRNWSNPTTPTGSVFIWVKKDYQIDTGAFLTVQTSNPGVIEFTAAEVFNADILFDITPPVVVGNRWDGVVHGIVNPNMVMDMAAASITGFGVDPLNIGLPTSTFLDALYDPIQSTNAFLFGRIDFDILVPSAFTELSLQIGTGLIVNNGVHLNPRFCSATINGDVVGDVNGDGSANLSDVFPDFIDALQPGVPYNPRADINCDGAVNLLDVQFFVDALGPPPC